MPRSEARIHVTIWDNRAFLALPGTAQRLYLFLTSQRDLTHCGVIPLRPARWVPKAAGMTLEVVLTDLGLLAAPAAPFVLIDEDTGELFIRSLIRHDEVWKQPNIMKSARESASLVESPRILAAMLAELLRVPAQDHESALVRKIHAEFVDALRDRCGNPSLNPSPNPSRDPSENPSPNPSRDPSQGKGEGYGPVHRGSPNPPAPTPRARTGAHGRACDPHPGQAPLLPVLPVPDQDRGEGEEEHQSETEDPVGELVTEIRAIRPSWSTKSIRRALTDPSVAERPWPVVRAAALTVARDPGSQVPGRLLADGPWWSAAPLHVAPGPATAWCEQCDERTRMVEDSGQLHPRTGEPMPGHCPRCSPRRRSA